MTKETLSKILGVDEKEISWNGNFFFYEKKKRCCVRIELMKEAIAFYTVWRELTADEKKEALRKLSGRVKHRGLVRVKNFKTKEDLERIRKGFERMK